MVMQIYTSRGQMMQHVSNLELTAGFYNKVGEKKTFLIV